MLKYLKTYLKKEQFDAIKFTVIQSGTGLKENINIGSYDVQRLTDMVNVCKSYGMLSKEHNGDYLPTKLIM